MTQNTTLQKVPLSEFLHLSQSRNYTSQSSTRPKLQTSTTNKTEKSFFGSNYVGPTKPTRNVHRKTLNELVLNNDPIVEQKVQRIKNLPKKQDSKREQIMRKIIENKSLNKLAQSSSSHQSFKKFYIKPNDSQMLSKKSSMINQLNEIIHEHSIYTAEKDHTNLGESSMDSGLKPINSRISVG